MERRTLTAGVTPVPPADREALREFVTQERHTPKSGAAESPTVSGRPPRSDAAVPRSRRNSKSAGVTPIGLIPITVRLRPEIAGALKRASLERQLSGNELFTQQDLVEHVLEPWLRAQGLLS